MSSFRVFGVFGGSSPLPAQVPANRVELFSRVVVGLASISAMKTHRQSNAKNRMASPRHYLLKTTRRAVPMDADTNGSKTDFRECINDGFEFLAREKPQNRDSKDRFPKAYALGTYFVCDPDSVRSPGLDERLHQFDPHHCGLDP
jgi:hypothetical protein